MEYPRRCSTSRNPFTIPILVSHDKLTRFKRRFMPVYALVDSGASSSYMDKKYVEDNHLPFVKKTDRVCALVADGRSVESGTITHETDPITVQIRDHNSAVVFNIVQLTSLTPVILGLSWLVQHNPLIDWRARELMLPRCLQYMESNAFRRFRISPVVFEVQAEGGSDVEEVLGFKLVKGRCFLQLRLISIVWEPIENVKASCERVEDVKIYMNGYRPPPGTLEVYGKREFEVDAILGVRQEGGEFFFQVRLGSVSWEPAGNVKVNGKFLKMVKEKVGQLLIENE